MVNTTATAAATVTETATIALMGQPNVGKSTIFNMLTGLNQHVGNWPGKTVERRAGTFEHDRVRVDIVDLPGAYCLTAASPEERIARDYIIQNRPDVVLVILSAASLERNLYLVTELLALPAPIVIGLNMLDVARDQGFVIDPRILAAAIGVPVVPMTASRGEGVHDLIDAALQMARHGPQGEPSRPEIREDHRDVMARLLALTASYVPAGYPPEWVTLKLLEGDQEISARMRGLLPPEVQSEVDDLLRRHEDALIAVASGRYDWIRRMTRAALERPRAGRITLTQRLDHVATHPFGGLVVLAVVLGLIFGLTYSIGAPLQDWMAEDLVGSVASWAAAALAAAPPWLSGLVIDGAIAGVGTVITFLPILFVFFVSMGFMEDVGYMARAAYMMDRFMHALGLHGKSFMPLFLGFGCNVPAIMGARVIESERGRLLTILLAPLVPCTARLAVLAVLAPALFPQNPTLVTWGLVALPLVVLAAGGAVASRLLARQDDAAFIMELPLYHVPNARTIGLLVWERILAFLKKAGSVILVVSILVWLLATMPHGEIESSYLAMAGRVLSPIGSLMGLEWRSLVALLTSFVAKENAVATLGVLYGVGEDTGAVARVLSASLTPASGLAFLVAQMLFIPCVSAVAAVRQETASWGWTLVSVASLSLLTIVGGAVAYRLALLML